MSAPYDWPSPSGTAGGCACDYCGVIYIGPEWEDACCRVCARDSDAGSAEADGTAAEPRSGGSAGRKASPEINRAPPAEGE